MVRIRAGMCIGGGEGFQNSQIKKLGLVKVRFSIESLEGY